MRRAAGARPLFHNRTKSGKQKHLCIQDAAGLLELVQMIAWNELGRVKSGDAFTIRNAAQRLRRRKVDPWAELDAVRQTLPMLDGQVSRRKRR